MIRRFTITGFKRFERETTIDLDAVTLLVGANNSGKSTILEALTLFQYCVETTRRANGKDPTKSLGLSRRSVSPDEFGVLPVAEPTDLWPNGRTTIGRKQQTVELHGEYDNGADISFSLKLSYNKFSISPRSSGDIATAIGQRDIRLIPIFSGLLPREEYLTLPARQERMRMQRHGETIRNLLWDLREHHEGRWNKLIDILRDLFPESALQIEFDVDFDRFLSATYRDRALTRELDVMVTGSGFHQAVQILASVLAPGARTLLLDEPDAHLHARLQTQLMTVLERLSREEQAQFILATHSPQLLAAAPAGAVKVCMDGAVVPFDVEPTQFRLLEDLGAMDRMEIVPLLTSRAIVFVENRSDQKLLERFARKHWGEHKQRDIWRLLTFMYTYQGPVEARVLDLARQVKDLLSSPGLSGQPVRMLAIGDRDYRTDASRRKELRTHTTRAKSPAYQLTFSLRLWEANEIENYLLDREAMLAMLGRQACEKSVAADWHNHEEAFVDELDGVLEEQRETVRQAIATRIQNDDRRLALSTALDQADEFLARVWQDRARWCDAKMVIRRLHAWLQARRLPLRINDDDIVDAMDAVPTDIQRVLRELQKLAGARRTGRGRNGN
ncbi:MAG: ATP-binding protein [Spirochaetaceae bacterium]|nr:ATP-binding protein [Spirochaetaceae bacterium]